MPKFTISRSGQVLQVLNLEADSIVMGSDRSCSIFIDDLLVSLKQAAFIKTPTGYQLEPKARMPRLNLNGAIADQTTPLQSGDIIEVEGYQIRVDFGGEPDDLDSGKTVFNLLPVVPLGKLQIVAGPLKGTVRDLKPGEIKIGRDQAQNDIVIRADSKGDVDKSISRRHASVFVEGTNAFIEDQKSVAGTFVNGRQIPPKERVPLKSGDQIEIRSAKESTILRVIMDAHSSAPPSSPPLADWPPLTPVSSVPPPLSDLSLPPPLPVTPPPVAPPPLGPPPRQAPTPVWEPPPEPGRAPISELESRRSRQRHRPTLEVNPFESVDEPSWFASVPKWVWFGGGAVLIILIVSFLLVCR
jgi:pSer/pThr/pTyr-binding forkhead associated (FHA) protein